MSAPQATPPAPKPGAPVIGFLVLLLGLVVILGNAGVTMPTVLPENIGTFTAVDTLFWVILWLTGFFFVLTEGLLVYFCLRYRKRADGKKAVHMHGSHTLELAWTFIPGLILFCLAVFQTGTWGDIKYYGEFPDEDDALVVQVLGQQFEWHFRYAGPDGVFDTEDDTVTVDIMCVPRDKKVVLHLQTRDVLHSFWLPNVRLKQDLVPGRTIRQWFECVKTGEYDIVCAELCGIGHTEMGATLKVVDDEPALLAWQEAYSAEYGAYDPSFKKTWAFWQTQPRLQSARKK